MKRRRAIAAIVGVVVVAGCSTGPKQVQVPGVVGQSAPDAVAKVEAAGLTARFSGRAPADDVAAMWVVTGQTPAATTGKVDEGTEVTLEAESILQRTADQCLVEGGVEDEGRSLVLDMQGRSAGSGDLTYPQVECALEKLDVPDATLARITATRALDGMQDAEWNGLKASWTYHPDHGLDVIIEIG